MPVVETNEGGGDMSDAEPFTLPGGGPPEEWPQSWTGQYVRLTLQGSRSPGERGDEARHEEVAGILLGVNPFGLAIAEGETREARFYPWTVVRRIVPRGEQR
jgi:hypothetical protein